MMKYSAIIRTIHSSGEKIIKLSSLLNLLRNIGFEDSRRDGQKGHLIINTPETDLPAIAENIIKAIKKEFNIDISILVKELI